MLRTIGIAAAFSIVCGPVGAAPKTMPIDFVGDWCFESEESDKISYALPSWSQDGRCTKILSINQYGFYNEGRNCEPVQMKLSQDVAHSGTAFIADVTARCRPDGPVTEGTLQTFELVRYKGHLTVSPK
jgi:hypothetical protein